MSLSHDFKGERKDIYDLLLSAARELLGKRGETGFNLTQVARHAGIDRGTAYTHFQTRQQLFEVAVAEMSAELRRIVFVNAQTIEDVMTRLAEFVVEYPEFGRIYLTRLFNAKRPHEDLFFREYLAFFRQFAEVDHAQSGIDVEVLAVTMLAGTLVWPMCVRAQVHGYEVPKNNAQRLVREIVRLSRRGAQRVPARHDH